MKVSNRSELCFEVNGQPIPPGFCFGKVGLKGRGILWGREAARKGEMGFMQTGRKV